MSATNKKRKAVERLPEPGGSKRWAHPTPPLDTIATTVFDNIQDMVDWGQDFRDMLLCYLDTRSKLALSETTPKCHNALRPHIHKYIYFNVHDLIENTPADRATEILTTLRRITNVHESDFATRPFPTRVTHIRLARDYNRPFPIGTLSDTKLTHLDLGFLFNQIFERGSLPNSLVDLSLSYTYDQAFQPGVITDTKITRFRLSDNYDAPFEIGSLPTGLTELVLGDKYNTEFIPGVLSATQLTKLVLGHGYDKTFAVGTLAKSLETLCLGPHYRHRFQRGVLSDTNLKRLFVGRWYGQPLEGAIPEDCEVQRIYYFQNHY